MNSPLEFSLSAEIRKATYSILNFGELYGDSLPKGMLKGAKGIALITTLKGGFMIGGRVGTGVLLGRLEDGTWSAPSAIGKE